MSVIRDLVGIYFKNKISRSAAQLAYYLTLSIFPLLICVNEMLGRLKLDNTELVQNLEGIIPAGAFSSIVDYLGYVSVNSSTAMFVMALVVLVTSSSAAFRSILTVMSEIQEEHSYTDLLKAGLSIILSVLFLIAVYISCIVIIAGDWLIGVISSYTGNSIFYSLWSSLRFLVLFLLLFVIIYAIYRISMPKGKMGRQRIIGALAAALVMVAASVFFSWTIGISAKYPLIYGSLASMIILMVWLFMCGNILIMGNAFNIAFNRYRDQRKSAKAHGAEDEKRDL